MKNEEVLAAVSNALRRNQRLPKHIELASLTRGTLVSVYDVVSSGIISESIFSGVDSDPTIATLKGLVEMVERRAFTDGRQNGITECQTKRSDGFAAFPKSPGVDAPLTARENALAEAIERYVWATWWDDSAISHSIRAVDLDNVGLGEELMVDVSKAVDINEVVEVRPALTSTTHVVSIYFAKLNPFGIISGGACGSLKEIENVRYRAISELIRHALAHRKMRLGTNTPETFYERRLAHFAMTAAGAQAAERRLSCSGEKSVTLPRLKWDAEIPHVLDETVAVHRCYFEGQPPFVGGELERLCL